MFVCQHRYDQQIEIPQWNKRQSLNKVLKVCTLLKNFNIFCGSWLNVLTDEQKTVLRKVLLRLCAVYFAALYSYHGQMS